MGVRAVYELQIGVRLVNATKIDVVVRFLFTKKTTESLSQLPGILQSLEGSFMIWLTKSVQVKISIFVAIER